MEFVVRFVQMHESFRQAETEALAELNGLGIEWISYRDDVSVDSPLRCRDN